MRKFRVSVAFWETEIEAEDSGYALMDADGEFDFISEARVEEIYEEEEDAI